MKVHKKGSSLRRPRKIGLEVRRVTRRIKARFPDLSYRQVRTMAQEARVAVERDGGAKRPVAHKEAQLR